MGVMLELCFRDTKRIYMFWRVQVKGFIAFMNKWGVIGLAIAVIIGGKLNAWVSALVEDIIMPILTFFIPGGAWRDAVWNLGPIALKMGHFIGVTIDFILIAYLVYWFFTHVLKDEAVASAGKK